MRKYLLYLFAFLFCFSPIFGLKGISPSAFSIKLNEKTDDKQKVEYAIYIKNHHSTENITVDIFVEGREKGELKWINLHSQKKTIILLPQQTEKISFSIDKSKIKHSGDYINYIYFADNLEEKTKKAKVQNSLMAIQLSQIRVPVNIRIIQDPDDLNADLSQFVSLKKLNPVACKMNEAGLWKSSFEISNKSNFILHCSILQYLYTPNKISILDEIRSSLLLPPHSKKTYFFIYNNPIIPSKYLINNNIIVKITGNKILYNLKSWDRLKLSKKFVHSLPNKKNNIVNKETIPVILSSYLYRGEFSNQLNLKSNLSVQNISSVNQKIGITFQNPYKKTYGHVIVSLRNNEKILSKRQSYITLKPYEKLNIPLTFKSNINKKNASFYGALKIESKTFPKLAPVNAFISFKHKEIKNKIKIDINKLKLSMNKNNTINISGKIINKGNVPLINYNYVIEINNPNAKSKNIVKTFFTPNLPIIFPKKSSIFSIDVLLPEKVTSGPYQINIISSDQFFTQTTPFSIEFNGTSFVKLKKI